jgi:hypothetical protein
VSDSATNAAQAGIHDNRPVGSAVQPCPKRHWFQLTLVLRPESQARPAWWPVERRAGYPREKVSLTLPGAAGLHTSDSSGRLRIDGVPPGVGSAAYYDFYSDVRSEFERGTVYRGK